MPAALGAPDAVAVTREPQGRFLVSLCWRERGRTIRLDEYPARLDIGFAKSVREQPEWISLSADSSDRVRRPDDTALWFPRPHLLGFWLVDAQRLPLHPRGADRRADAAVDARVVPDGAGRDAAAGGGGVEGACGGDREVSGRGGGGGS